MPFFDPPPCELPGYPSIWSNDRSYRYTLWRTWTSNPRPKFVQFIGLNPSTADDTKPDPTVTRCINFAKSWGYRAMCMTNIFAYKSTNPNGIRWVENPVGEYNDHWLLTIYTEADLSIACWGLHGTYKKRSDAVRLLLPNLHCLKMSKNGQPMHPLYLPANLKPIPLAA